MNPFPFTKHWSVRKTHSKIKSRLRMERVHKTLSLFPEKIFKISQKSPHMDPFLDHVPNILQYC